MYFPEFMRSYDAKITQNTINSFPYEIVRYFLCSNEAKTTSNDNNVFKWQFLINNVMFYAKWVLWKIHIEYLIIKHIIDNIMSALMKFLELIRSYEAKIT
jgi:hypothetical protein